MSAPSAAYRALMRPVQRALRAVGSRIANLDPRFYYKRDVAWCHDLSWMEEYQPYLSFDGRGGRRILDRRFTIVQMARAVRALRGCTAECGVARGVGSAVICKTLGDTFQNGERHFGFDSFEGVAEPRQSGILLSTPVGGGNFPFRRPRLCQLPGGADGGREVLCGQAGAADRVGHRAGLSDSRRLKPWDRLPACHFVRMTGWKPIPRPCDRAW